MGKKHDSQYANFGWLRYYMTVFQIMVIGYKLNISSNLNIIINCYSSC